jgi:endonuclease G, mitochondrial
MIKYFLSAIALACSFTVNAQSQDEPLPLKACEAHVPFGQPTSAKQDTTLICREGYFLEHDNKAKIPIWISYVLTPDKAVGCEKRLKAFKADRSLPDGKRSDVKDYAKSGYDMGHIANSADMSWNFDVARQSFILSNMTPQTPGFNRGIWKKLEDQTRAWAVSRSHNILIYAGPIYDIKQDKTIGNNMVTVPDGFYKVLVDLDTKEVLSFHFKHESGFGSLNQYVTSLAQVQKESKLVFPMPKQVKFSDTIWESSTHNVSKAKSEVCAIY